MSSSPTVFRTLRELRLERQMSLKELADATGINKGTLSGIERGRIVATAVELNSIGDVLAERLENRTVPGRDVEVPQ